MEFLSSSSKAESKSCVPQSSTWAILMAKQALHFHLKVEMQLTNISWNKVSKTNKIVWQKGSQ